jgi:hypothetical protein
MFFVRLYTCNRESGSLNDVTRAAKLNSLLPVIFTHVGNISLTLKEETP